MKNYWLSATNFENMYDLVLAITTLSLYYKTKFTEIEGEQFTEQEIQEATKKVSTYLEQMRQALETAELNPDHIVTGTNPQFSRMVVQYRSNSRRSAAKGNFYAAPIEHVIESLQSVTKDNYPQIVGYLQEMRSLIDQTSATDVNNLLGDL